MDARGLWLTRVNEARWHVICHHTFTVLLGRRRALTWGLADDQKRHENPLNSLFFASTFCRKCYSLMILLIILRIFNIIKLNLKQQFFFLNDVEIF